VYTQGPDNSVAFGDIRPSLIMSFRAAKMQEGEDAPAPLRKQAVRAARMKMNFIEHLSVTS